MIPDNSFICQGGYPVSPYKKGERITARDGQFSGIENVYLFA